jgi:hypothetical protein
MKYLKYFREQIAWHPDGPEEVIHVDDVCKELNNVLNVLGINVEHSMVDKKLIGGCTEKCRITYEFDAKDITIMGILFRGWHFDTNKPIRDLEPYYPVIEEKGILNANNIMAKSIYVGAANITDKINNNGAYCYPTNNKILYNTIYNTIINFIPDIIRFQSGDNKIVIFRYNIAEIKKNILDYIKNPEIIPDLFISEIIRIIVQNNDYNLIKDIKIKQPKIWKQIENEETLKGLIMSEMGFGD